MGRLTYGMANHLNAQRKAATPEACERRRLAIMAADSARADLIDRFPEVTPENFWDADRYHKNRLSHYRQRYGVDA